MVALVATRAPVTNALLTSLEGLGFPVGDGRVPDPPDGAAVPTLPYLIVYPLDGADADDANLGGVASRGAWPHQVTAVGKTRRHAEMLLDRVRDHLLGRPDGGGWTNPLTLTAGTVIGRTSEGPGTPDHAGELVSVPERYVFLTTATGGSG